jgi:tRNA pseudouridine38-40 synthase
MVSEAQLLFMNIKCLISYDGFRYLGWQATSAGPSISATIQQVLEKILQCSIKLQAASRTDRGVHALEQVMNFHVADAIDLRRVQFSANSLLPADIRILHMEIAPDTFHASCNAQKKSYLYQVETAPILLPHQRNYYWHYHYPIRSELMERAKIFFIGKKDFSAFCNEHREDTQREIFSIDLSVIDKTRVHFRILGNKFLYKMVRNLIGTLVYVGHGRVSMQAASILLSKKKRRKAAMTAPAHGLFLEKVYYG